MRPFELFVGLRYTRAKRRTHFISFISFISIAGIALGIWALISVMSVMNGFEKEIRSRILGAAAHIQIVGPEGGVPNWEKLAAEVKKHPEVIAAAPFVNAQGLLSTGSSVRGVFVLTRFFGMDAPDPPANVPALSEGPANQTGTLRGRMMAHKSNPSCATCHAIFDPLGLALENFDAIGRWRVTDGGSPIDASGTFIDGTRFSSPAELRAGLLKYRDAYYTSVTQQLLAYALNRKGKAGRVYDYEMPAVRKIVRDASVNGYRWSAILAGVGASAPFQMKNVVP